jgi:thioredoxin 1
MFVKNPELKELFYMIATKKIAESGKSIDLDQFIISLHKQLDSEDSMNQFGQFFKSRFTETEIAEIRSILEKDVYEKFLNSSPDIMKESVQQLDKIIDDMISKEKSAVNSKPSTITNLTADNFTEEVLNSKLPVVLDFYAEWCVPCKGMHAIMQSLSNEYEGKIKFTKLDIDKAKEIAEKFKVKDLPVILFIKEGKIVRTQNGFAEKQFINDKIKESLL